MPGHRALFGRRLTEPKVFRPRRVTIPRAASAGYATVLHEEQSAIDKISVTTSRFVHAENYVTRKLRAAAGALVPAPRAPQGAPLLRALRRRDPYGASRPGGLLAAYLEASAAEAADRFSTFLVKTKGPAPRARKGFTSCGQSPLPFPLLPPISPMGRGSVSLNRISYLPELCYKVRGLVLAAYGRADCKKDRRSSEL